MPTCRLPSMRCSDERGWIVDSPAHCAKPQGVQPMSYDIVIKTKTGETSQFPTTHGHAVRIRLDEVHYELTHRYEVNSGSCCLFPSGFSFEERISAYYENEHGYWLMVTRTMDGKMSFTSDFPRDTGEAYTSLEEARGSESYRGFVALVRRMNKYRREAMSAFADPSKAKRKVDLEEVFAEIDDYFRTAGRDK